ncbi:MAG: type VI secretion system tip protein VgrG, partial [bacterium]|nr:type VI secretion system tip protein VgrG [bacterium]
EVFLNNRGAQIIKDVLNGDGVTDIQDDLRSAGQTTREYCVQYGESNFEFISRLMEEEGIAYTFSHKSSLHKMILMEAVGSYTTCTQSETIALSTAHSGALTFNEITTCEVHHSIALGSVQGVDYNFENPGTSLKSTSQGDSQIGGEWMEYPAGVDHEQKATQTQVDSLSDSVIGSAESPVDTLTGSSTCPFFTSGGAFGLSGHIRTSLNKSHVLVSIEHSIEVQTKELSGIAYRNSFSAIPATVFYTSAKRTTRPRIFGSQTAKVVGPAGEEIWTDKYGRIKVKFHWDLSATANEGASCWIRVSQMLAGKNWGTLFTPRIGQEVVVSFLEGNPDRPLVTGAVYNGDHLPPYLPDTPTKSTMKTWSTKDGQGGYNELRFEDKKGEEEVFLHAQKDLNEEIEDTRSTQVKTGDDNLTVSCGDKVTLIKGDEGASEGSGTGNETTGINKGNSTLILYGEGDGKGSRITKIEKGDNTLNITKGDENKTLTEGNQSATLTKGNRSAALTKGNDTLTLTQGDQSTTLTQGDQSTTLTSGDRTTDLTNGNDTFTIAQGDQTISINTGKRTITVMDNEKHTNQGDYDHTVTGGYTLKVLGDLSIQSMGDMDFKSAKGIKFQCAQSLDIQTGAGVDVKAGGSMAIKSASTMTVQTAGAVSIRAGGACDMAGGGQSSVSGGARTSGSALALNQNMGAMARVN